MNPKSIFLSKTFWVQIVTVLSLAVPAVREWLDANPEQFVAVFAALNVLVRFVTSGRINIFGAGETTGNTGGSPGGLPIWIVMGTAVALLGSLPSCTPAQIEAARAIPIRIGIQGPDAELSYSSKSGLSVNAIVRGTK